jgi:hypothetical protein
MRKPPATEQMDKAITTETVPREKTSVRLGQSLILPDLNFRIPMPRGVRPLADAPKKSLKRDGSDSADK